MTKYHYFSDGSYDAVLEQFSKTKVNSEKTSSIPLADFWHTRNKERVQKFIIDLKLDSFDFDKAKLIFEYPTYALSGQGKKLPHSHPSMTDLMIIDNNYQIAIEAKYTEYIQDREYKPTISGWLGKDQPEHKLNILQKWCEYIQNAKGTRINLLDCLLRNGDIPYQFIHRIASAYYQTEINGKIPVLIYQLFYDENDLEELKSFKSKLEEWSKLLQLSDKIKFLIVSIPVKNEQEISKTYKGIKSELFLRMKEKSVYEFDWDKIENVLL